MIHPPNKKNRCTVGFYICIFIVLFACPFVITPASALKREVKISGQTMGTFYTVKYVTGQLHTRPVWEKKIEVVLKQVNKRLSMYDPESELSLFNRKTVDVPVQVSNDLFFMIQTGRRLYEMTHGAWDGTIKPLVDLWGFGTLKKPVHPPGTEAVRTALDDTGYKHIHIHGPRRVSKNKPVCLDLGSVAKGYGVDQIARLFISSGIKNVLVNIGGELFAAGTNINGKPWTVGISRPDTALTGQTIYKILKLNNQAIATSGNYRNFYEHRGTIYSHIIDPRTGYPVKNQIVSASVIANDCVIADGLATALMVMDLQSGLDLINQLDQTECLIVQQVKSRSKDGHEYIDHVSHRFNRHVIQTP
jgi:thiamine biosynthesis lipoprotein